MSRVVLDIETLAFPMETFDEAQVEYLLKFSETEKEKEEALQKLSLYPTTAQIIAIGMFNPDTERGKVLFQADASVPAVREIDGSVFVVADEQGILEQFWQDITHFDQFITFNGRNFDCPFILIRSAIKNIAPTKNLMPYRYDASVHCDLLEQLSFYGAFRKFNLDFYCKSFGIESPKANGVTGLDLKRLTDEKRFQDIAEYNLGDVRATAKLFKRWEKFLK
jgi:hypothetical protein